MNTHVFVVVVILTMLLAPGSMNAQDIWPPEESVAADGFRIDTMTLHRFRSDTWEDSKLEQYLYDDNDNLVRKEFFSENNGEWRLTRRETYTTDNGNIVSILKEDKRVNVFHASEQRNFQYSDGKLSLSTIDAIGPNAQVIPVFRNEYSYAYSDSGSVTSIEQLQHVNGSLKNIKTVTLAHDSLGTLLNARKMSARGGEMQLVETLDYQYDERGRLSGREWSFLGEEGWASPFQAEFEVFDDSTVIVSTQTFGGETSVSGKRVIKFDEHNNVISNTVFRWMNDKFVPGRREVYSYVQSE